MRPFVLLVCVLSCVVAACGDRVESDTAPIVSSVPFVDGERLRYGLIDDMGAKIAEGTLTVSRSGDSLRLDQSYRSLVQESTDTANILVHPETLRPHLMERVVQGPDGTAEYRATYGSDSRTVDLERDDEQPRTLKLPAHAYDNESSLWLWRALPFADDYDARYVSVNTVERSRQTVAVTVTARERLEVPAGAFETWRVQVRNGRATGVAWVSVDTPHQVVQWDNGEVTFRLEAVVR
jgi:hypothetical protein